MSHRPILVPHIQLSQGISSLFFPLYSSLNARLCPSLLLLLSHCAASLTPAVSSSHSHKHTAVHSLAIWASCPHLAKPRPGYAAAGVRLFRARLGLARSLGGGRTTPPQQARETHTTPTKKSQEGRISAWKIARNRLLMYDIL